MEGEDSVIATTTLHSTVPLKCSLKVSVNVTVQKITGSGVPPVCNTGMKASPAKVEPEKLQNFAEETTMMSRTL